MHGIYRGFDHDIAQSFDGMWRFTLTFWCLILASVTSAYDNKSGIFDAHFRSLMIEVAGHDMYPAVIALGGDERIMVSFDELAEEHSYLHYSLTHCDASWQPSGLVYTEFTEGFNENEIVDFQYSEATTVHYVHYCIEIPNERMPLKISGNYIMKVYREDDPDKTLLQARFSISENRADVIGGVTSRTDIDINGSYQQLNFTINLGRENIHNIYSDLKVVVTQNGRLDNLVMLSSPQRVSEATAYYEHMRELIFPAGNEYRRFEISSVTYPGMNVAEITFADPYYHADLYEDHIRSGQTYVYDNTQYGRYKIREYNSTYSDVQADYVLTHFSLDSPRLPGYDIYIDGDLGYRRFSPDTKMHYNYDNSRYELVMLLKQGAYNYNYLAVPIDADSGLTSVIEGDYHQTVNEYIIKVYYRAPGERYDRLLGVATIFSGT